MLFGHVSIIVMHSFASITISGRIEVQECGHLQYIENE